MDDRHGTLVVTGEKGRTHFFSLAGRLVSSVRYSSDGIEGKLKNGIWRRATMEEVVTVRTCIEGPES